MQGPIFKATLSSVTLSTNANGTDLFEIATPATSRIAICGFELANSSTADFSDAQAEGVAVQLIRGSTTTGSGGAAITPVNTRPWSRASVCTVAGNNTTLASSANTSVLHASAWAVQAPYRYKPQYSSNPDQFDERDFVAESSRCVVRLPTPPADPITVSATIWWQELGLAGG